MRRIIVIAALLVMSLFIIRNALAGGACDPGSTHKTTICHIPPGNPGNAHTLCVGNSAVPAHLAHGDCLGECPCATEPCGNGSCEPNAGENCATCPEDCGECGCCQVGTSHCFTCAVGGDNVDCEGSTCLEGGVCSQDGRSCGSGS